MSDLVEAAPNRSGLRNPLLPSKAKKQISQSDIVIVMVGKDTHNAPGVEKEVAIANQLKKPIFQIMPQEATGGKVRCAGELIEWKWKKIDEMIKELLK